MSQINSYKLVIKVFGLILVIILFVGSFQGILNQNYLDNNVISEASHTGFSLVGIIPPNSDTESTLNLSLLIIGKVILDREKSLNLKADVPINRQIIKMTVVHNPGISLREIQRTTGLAMGVVQYHLRYLETEEIESFRHGRCKHFFDSDSSFSYKEKLWLSILRNPNIKSILTFLASNKNECFQKDLIDSTGNSRALISYYIKNLKQNGIIKGNCNQLLVTEEFIPISKNNYHMKE
ncbi:MAG: winged helix-turn-helix transcriptional regulator [Candidatus Hodarchaeales archaeon]